MSLPKDIELDAAAWELSGMLGIDIMVQGNDLVLDPEQVDDWWADARDRVMIAYEKYREVP
jgi:virulence-associated protein VagC